MMNLFFLRAEIEEKRQFFHCGEMPITDSEQFGENESSMYVNSYNHIDLHRLLNIC